MLFDLSNEMKSFYENYAKVKDSVYSDLRDKKKKNISRLESGLEKNNNENSTEYEILETREQGSVAMATIVQNDEKDYDIDVGIIFEEDNIGCELGAIAAKNIVFNALNEKMGSFNEGPEYKTNCIRIKYTEGYHIDFAVYKKCGEEYWHAGASWSKRNPKAINEWFATQVQNKGEKLREVVRLSKMFCKSRPSWDMPAGLIQTVLINECFFYDERLDLCLYNTLNSVACRLKYNKQVINPTDSTKTLLTRQKDNDRLENFMNRLEDKLQNLANASDKKTTRAAWQKFFNNDFWKNSTNALAESVACYSSDRAAPGEEFIENYCDEVDLQYDVYIEPTVRASGFRDCSIFDFLRQNRWLPHDKTLIFKAKTNAPLPYKIKWKVKNIGPEAEKRECQRGQIINCDKGTYNQRTEHSNFYGPHYVECYVIKDNKCVAITRIDVPISR